MRLSTKGRYAVMAMADLARNGQGEGGARAVSLAEIATRQEISLSYLEQLFARLRKGGLVQSVRGPGGGSLGRHKIALITDRSGDRQRGNCRYPDSRTRFSSE